MDHVTNNSHKRNQEHWLVYAVCSMQYATLTCNIGKNCKPRRLEQCLDLSRVLGGFNPHQALSGFLQRKAEASIRWVVIQHVLHLPASHLLYVCIQYAYDFEPVYYNGCNGKRFGIPNSRMYK